MVYGVMCSGVWYVEWSGVWSGVWSDVWSDLEWCME